MKKETKIITTVCDCCGNQRNDATAIVGFQPSDWFHLYGNDLCYVCYRLVGDEIIKHTPDETIKKIIKEISKERKPASDAGSLYDGYNSGGYGLNLLRPEG
ncbi:MAG: hypothetical protein J7L15_01430 [Clostridiales bacterium]|nr:hypothetical protein [Clostridiales bacterium]